MRALTRIPLPVIAVALLFITIVTSVSSAYTLTSRFNAHFGTPGFYGSTLTVLLTAAANTTGTPISNSSLVCTGVPLSFSTDNITNFSMASTVVECPYSCDYRDTTSPLSAFPAPILFIDQAAYAANITYQSQQVTWCRYKAVLPITPHPLGIYVADVPYYEGTTYRGNGRVNSSLFCWGNASVNTIFNGVSMPNPFTPATAGNVVVNASMNFGECSFFARSYETDGATLDCVYSSSATTNLGASDLLSFKVITGPVFSLATSPGTIYVKPKDNVTFMLEVKNTGDLNATINLITMSQGFSVNNFTPTTINAGQTVTLTIDAKAPDVETTLTPNVTIFFSSSASVIGTCNAGQQDLSAGTFIISPIPPGPIPPVSVKLRATPSAIILKDGKFLVGNAEIFHINVNGTIKRSWPDGDDKVDVDQGNVTIKRFDLSAGIWRTVSFSVYTFQYMSNQPAHYCDPYVDGGGCNQYASSGMNYDIKSISNDTSIITLRQPINYPPLFSWCGPNYACSSPWQTGVYSATADVWDPLNKSVQSATAYFVIFDLNCKDST